MKTIMVIVVSIFLFGCATGSVSFLDGQYSWPARNEIVVENGGNNHLVVTMNGRTQGEIGPGQAKIMRVPPGSKRTVNVSVRHYDGPNKKEFLGTSSRTFRFWGRAPATHMWVVDRRSSRF